jgi:UDP-N-acetylglucosamine diphosphorylase/glucosamine-1-phosphate N-acetyltransferase
MNIAYFEDEGYRRLLPLTWLRAGFELRCGCDRLVDKVRARLGARVARLWVRDSIRAVVAERLPLDPVDPNAGWCALNARTLATGRVPLPEPGLAWRQDGELLAAGLSAQEVPSLTAELFSDPQAREEWLRRFRFEEVPDQVRLIRYPWDLIVANPTELRRQCQAGGMHQGHVYPGAHLVQPGQIHIAPGARVKPGVVLDAEEGPIHIDRDALVQPNAAVEGPCYIGPGSIIRPGASIRGGTSIGPVCKVGGEIDGSIIHGYTNKQHDGFLGHSYVAEWINLGADTVTSDLKNTYGTIRVFINGVGVETGQHFIGSIIGDHSKTGIGTILPTGCVIGVAANVFTQRPLPKFIPSFAWLTDEGMTGYRVEKAVQIARTVMLRREVCLSDDERQLIEHVAEAARQIEAAGWA